MKPAMSLLLLALALSSAAIYAQSPPSFDGTWRMTSQRPGADRPRIGQVVLAGASGTWKTYAYKTIETINNPCIGNVFPLTIQPNALDADLTFRVTESQSILGCPDFDVTLHAVTATRLEGKTGGGVVVTMERDG